MSKKYFIGIDLGTTFSAVSVFDETGTPKIVHNLPDGQNITPSCVTKIDDKYVVGEQARRSWTADNRSRDAAGRFKLDMGTDIKYHIYDKEFTPTELSAMVLKKLKQDAEQQLGGDIGEAVVTIPANFPHKARESTMRAAKEAGLTVKSIINEPTAAALYYAFKGQIKMDGVYAVYDLGGGTFDISIIDVRGNDIEVLASEGDWLKYGDGRPASERNFIGGDYFDRVLQKIVLAKYKHKAGEMADERDYDLDNAEADKKSLSTRQNIKIKVLRELIEVSREEFESGISDEIQEAENYCKEAIKEAVKNANKSGKNITPSDIQGVLLAGGSTRIPLVLKSIERVFGQEPVTTTNVDEAVSMGAAVYVAYRVNKAKDIESELSDIQKKSVQGIAISERTSKCFGCISLDRNEEHDINNILIEKGTEIPKKVTKYFYTISDNQEKVECRVTESPYAETDPYSEHVTEIWKGDLMLNPPYGPKGRKIDVTFSYDENQTMHCEFLDTEFPSNKKEVHLSMAQSATGDVGHDIAKLTVE